MRTDEAGVRSNRKIAEGREVTERKSPRTEEQCLPRSGRCDPGAGYGARVLSRGLHTRLRGRIPMDVAPAPRSSARSSLFVYRPASRSEVTEGNLGVPLFVYRPHRGARLKDEG